MKRALLVLLLGFVVAGPGAACSFSGAEGQPDPADDGPGDPDGGSGQPRDPEDLDGDGVKNATDNCPANANPDQEDGDDDGVGDACDNCPLKANPKKETMGLGLVQRDHDADGKGDECDLCPHIKDEPNVDADGDGIGAACDPNDGQKNPPPIFNGFYDPPVAAEWQAISGGVQDWELTQLDGRLWWKQKNPNPDRRQIVRNLPAFREAYVDTLFRVHTIAAGGGTNLRSASAVYGYDNSVYFNCGIRHDTGSLNNEAMTAVYNSDTVLGANALDWTGALVDRDIHVVGESSTRGGGSRLNCSANAAPATNIMIPASDSTYAPDGRIGLRTFGMVTSFDYLFIVNKAAAPQ